MSMKPGLSDAPVGLICLPGGGAGQTSDGD